MIGITKTSSITEDLLPKTKQIMTREELDKLIEDTGVNAVNLLKELASIIDGDSKNIEIENPKSTDIYIATIGDAAKTKSFGLIKSLRDNHISTDIDHLGKSLKAQFKYSDKINAKYTIVIGDDELAGDSATLKNMSTSEQTTVKISELVDELKKIL